MSGAENAVSQEKRNLRKKRYRNQDLKTYLTKYQCAYRKGDFLPRLPDNLREIFYELKSMFNVAIASIDEMIEIDQWLIRVTYESSSYYKDKRNHKRNKRVQGKMR